MRKLCRVFFCVGIFILLLQFASALNINLDESYERSETVIAKIDGSVLNTISLSKMKVLRKGYIYSAVDKGIQRLGDDYYLWFNAPNLADDYTLVLEDVSTIVGGIPKVIDYAVDFSVSAIKTDYSIKPGFIYAYNDFEVEIVLYEDYSKSIDLSFPTSRSVVLRSGSNDVDFDVGNVVGVQLVEISIGKYNFPAYIIGSEPIEPIMSVCGNNIIEDGEICECGIDMTFGNWDDLIEDETCQTLGYDDGELSCLSDCSGINISACVNDEEPTEFVCGNNIIEDGEICECGIDGICGNVDDKLNLTTCDDFGFDSGNLSCSICAEFNVEACFNISEENVTNVTQVVNITNVTQSGNISFKISPQYIKVTELINSEDLGYVFSIFNNGNVSIENILFYYDRELFLIAPEGNVSIAPNSSLEFSVAVLENNESIIEGTFILSLKI